jgi:2-hydroxy-6-oxonona-2,4-dienedioate hydrolase
MAAGELPPPSNMDSSGLEWLQQYISDALGAAGVAGTGQKVDVVGESLGATAALIFAATNPERCGRVVIVSPFGLGHSVIGSPATSSELATHLTGLLSSSPTDFISGLQALTDSPPHESAITDYVGRILPVLSSFHLSRPTMATLANPDPDRRRYTDLLLRSVKAPVLILSGRQDPFIGLDELFFIGRRLRNAELRVLDKCGHLPSIDSPRRFQTVVSSFLKSGR